MKKEHKKMECMGLHDHSDLQPSNLESHIADFKNTNNVTSSDKPNSISSQFYANEESHQMVGESSDISNSLSINFCENDDVVDGSNVESDVVLCCVVNEC
ncbi:hypothetical protein LOK49_LG14G00184 [Camellia lanceoleosa]|uniref:Uncharacterized protein n=1 Tax=Camellia lanceoleosa TaxID=1840588 RepID=A0ACC0F9P1_9ERIC|nr:hypothetical protein LOK49_LG14G00184 [Camellia lanceoleosa]